MAPCEWTVACTGWGQWSLCTLSHSHVWGSSPAQPFKDTGSLWIRVHNQNTLVPQKNEICYRVFVGLFFCRLSTSSSYLKIYDCLTVYANSLPSPSKQVKITLLSTQAYTGGPPLTWSLWLTSRGNSLSELIHLLFAILAFFFPVLVTGYFSAAAMALYATSFCGIKKYRT